MPQATKDAASYQATTVVDEQTRIYDKVTLGLIRRDVSFTLIFILAQLLFLLSSAQSVELIKRHYKPPDPNAPPLQPAATALMGSIVGAVAVVGLVAVAYDRLKQQIKRYCSGEETDIALWPQALIVITGFVLIIVTALRAIAVRQKQQDEARVVIL